MIPVIVIALAQEAERFGATVIFRECGHGHEHVDIFDAPDELVIRLWDAGFRASEQRSGYWRWCMTTIDFDEKPTTPPAAL